MSDVLGFFDNKSLRKRFFLSHLLFCLSENQSFNLRLAERLPRHETHPLVHVL
jgi:hypothetical protein